MTIDSDNNPDRYADDTTSDSPHDTPLGVGVIVDDQGKPYKQKPNAYKELKTLIYNVYARIPHGERLMIFLTSVIALSTVCQMVISCNNNASTGRQVGRIIAAADGVKEAADNFSQSAAGINTGMKDAVAKLNLQADKLNENATETGRLADNTGKANENVIEADRPWMGAYPNVVKFVVGEKPNFAFAFQNSGKRPAISDMTAYHFSAYRVFPDPETQFPYNKGENSTGVVVPGAVSTTGGIGDSILDQPTMDALNAGVITYYAFAKVEYRDIRTNEHFFTHVCIRYIPKLKTDTDPGWKNCYQYNDAK